MLERFFVKPETIDRIRASWIGEPIERYVVLLFENGYSSRTIHRRVPLLMHFGAYARARGAKTWDDLPAYVASFRDRWTKDHGQNCKTKRALKGVCSPRLMT